MQEMVMGCAAAEGASEDDLGRTMAMEVPKTREGSCATACMMEKAGLLVDGKFSLENSYESAKKVTDNNEAKLAIIKIVSTECQATLAASTADRYVTLLSV